MRSEVIKLALPVSIHSLLSGREVEWARIEFKTTWDPAASLKTICAFANDLDNWGGGYIVLGVEQEVRSPSMRKCCASGPQKKSGKAKPGSFRSGSVTAAATDRRWNFNW